MSDLYIYCSLTTLQYFFLNKLADDNDDDDDDEYFTVWSSRSPAPGRQPGGRTRQRTRRQHLTITVQHQSLMMYTVILLLITVGHKRAVNVQE